VGVSLRYTTRCFRRRPDHLNGDLAAIIPPAPDGKIGGVMLAQERWRWTVTLIAQFGPTAPAEMDGFVEFARKLPAPYIYEVVRSAEPMGEPALFAYHASVRRRYEKLRRFPEGYLVMGDAICSFNPVYGQGMTVAAKEALELKAVLAGGMDRLAQHFFARVSKLIDVPWGMAVGNDLRIPEATGSRTSGVRAINAYMTKLHKAAHHDPAVALVFHRVANLLSPPAAVMHPGIAARVAWSAMRRALWPRQTKTDRAGGRHISEAIR
jgi:2-polyprenyl-6-methoxyphenol hydroxylase-like FAD-dependent oxidoreductase